ncbi:MAG: hypothetical protein FWH04_00100 [Oscillospiraceae bacterium]|nr:hypothetical protein [Oscillospiraceae bacterium]
MRDVDVKVELVDQYGDPWIERKPPDFNALRATLRQLDEREKEMENVALSICTKNKHKMSHNTRLMMIQSKAVGWQGLMPDEEELAERPDFWEMEPEKEPPPVVRPKMTGAERNIFLRGNVKEPPEPVPSRGDLPDRGEMERLANDKELRRRLMGEMLDDAQLMLDAAGMVPVIGEPADGANALIYAARGDGENALMSALGMVPIAGWFATGSKVLGKVTGKASRKVPKAIFKKSKKIVSRIDTKISRQISKRGWSTRMIDDVVNNPHTTRSAVNKSTGGSATAYYNQAGDYVVRDNATGNIIQISEFGNKGWKPDSSIIDPFTP